MKTSPSSIAIVASEFNGEFVDGLVASAESVLGTHPKKIVRVPGAYEIPLAVQRLIRQPEIGAVVAFAVIWQGKTAHADIIARDVSRSLMDLMLEHDKPVIQQILTVADEQQARERCFGDELNRGKEGAQAALKMLELSI